MSANSRSGLRRIFVSVVGATVGCFAEPPPVDHGGETTSGGSGTAATTMSTAVSADETGEVSTLGTSVGSDSTDATTEADASTTDASLSETTATTGPEHTCGNDIIEATEECDDGNRLPGDGCHSDCTLYQLVFVTNDVFSGALGGLAGADAHCQSAAEAAGIEGEYRAWLSDDAMSAGVRLQGSGLAYRLRDGTLVANDWPDVVDGAIASAIYLDEHGRSVASEDFAWTGTNEFGAGAGASCANWQTTAATGGVGAVDWAESAQWTASDEHGCDLQHRLYCFQQ